MEIEKDTHEITLPRVQLELLESTIKQQDEKLKELETYKESRTTTHVLCISINGVYNNIDTFDIEGIGYNEEKLKLRSESQHLYGNIIADVTDKMNKSRAYAEIQVNDEINILRRQLMEVKDKLQKERQETRELEKKFNQSNREIEKVHDALSECSSLSKFNIVTITLIGIFLVVNHITNHKSLSMIVVACCILFTVISNISMIQIKTSKNDES
jgi:chromosome segregation ATPase